MWQLFLVVGLQCIFKYHLSPVGKWYILFIFTPELGKLGSSFKGENNTYLVHFGKGNWWGLWNSKGEGPYVMWKIHLGIGGRPVIIWPRGYQDEWYGWGFWRSYWGGWRHHQTPITLLNIILQECCTLVGRVLVCCPWVWFTVVVIWYTETRWGFIALIIIP